MLVSLLILALLAPEAFSQTKTLRYSENASPTTMDPVQSATTYSNMLVTAIYDTLYEYKYLKVPAELKPSLAASMPDISKDGLTYTIALKKGVMFADDPAFPSGKGREVTAEDVVYSLKRHFDPKNRSQGEWVWRGRIVGLDDWKKAGADYGKEVSGLKVIDKHKFQIRLVKPYPQILYTLAMGFSAVVAKEAVEKYGVEISIKPVGSGPFLLESFTPQKAVLVKNPQFRKETLDLKAEGYDEGHHGRYDLKKIDGQSLPILDRIEINFMKQPTARWNSFTKGSEIQFASVPHEQVDRVLSSKNPVTLKEEFEKKYHFLTAPESGFVYSGFNMAKKEFGYAKDKKTNEDNRALRCAIRKAFNWRQRINRFYYGIGDPFPGIIPPHIADYSPLSDDSIKLDIKGAKKLLKEAGWTKANLPVLTYGGVSSIRNKQTFEQLRGFLLKIGYPRTKIKLKQYATFGDYNKALKNSELPFVSLAWGLDYPDAENLMQLFYGPNGSPGSNNVNFDHPEFNALYEKIAVMQRSPERTEIFKRMNEIIIDECVLISGFSRTDIFLWHKNVLMVPSRSPHGNVFKYIDVL